MSLIKNIYIEKVIIILIYTIIILFIIEVLFRSFILPHKSLYLDSSTDTRPKHFLIDDWISEDLIVKDGRRVHRSTIKEEYDNPDYYNIALVGDSVAFGNFLATSGTQTAIVSALALNFFATVIIYVCLNAYVLDYIARIELGKSETLRLFYSALGWTLGPVLGVFLWRWWPPSPFIFSAASAFVLLLVFLYMRLGNGKHIVKARTPAINPLSFMGRFVEQPRLVVGWSFAVI
jgi:hypothetical protein